MKPQKVIRDGKVAALISPKYGGGWSTWANAQHQEMLLFDRRFVEAAEAGVEDINPIIKEVFGEDVYIYPGGWEGIEIVWLPKGESFCLHVYDGAESLNLFGGEYYFTA